MFAERGITLDLKTFALGLKKELSNEPSSEKAKQIALRIEQAKHSDGTGLTKEEKEHILKYLEFPIYDHITGYAVLHEADNSVFLQLVEIVSNNIKEKK